LRGDHGLVRTGARAVASGRQVEREIRGAERPGGEDARHRGFPAHLNGSSGVEDVPNVHEPTAEAPGLKIQICFAPTR
jgi:hypothetical protein